MIKNEFPEWIYSPVSYTHLTQPTNTHVYITVVGRE